MQKHADDGAGRQFNSRGEKLQLPYFSLNATLTAWIFFTLNICALLGINVIENVAGKFMMNTDPQKSPHSSPTFNFQILNHREGQNIWPHVHHTNVFATVKKDSLEKITLKVFATYGPKIWRILMKKSVSSPAGQVGYQSPRRNILK